MNFIQSFLLAFSLSLDCFAISISHGLKSNKSRNSIITLSLMFGIFQSLMFILGFYLGSYILSFFSSFTSLLAMGLLFFIGIKMIKEGLAKDEDNQIETSGLKEYLLLSLATSIDALAAGISYTTIKTDFILTIILIGVISFLLTLIGGFSGKQIGEKFGKKSEIFGGLVLIGLAIKTYFQ